MEINGTLILNIIIALFLYEIIFKAIARAFVKRFLSKEEIFELKVSKKDFKDKINEILDKKK